MSICKVLNQCPLTGDTENIKYLDLGLMPLANNLYVCRKDAISCPRYPLSVHLYVKSQLSMLSHAIDPRVLFSNYFYKSSIGQPYIEHCKKMYEYISRFIHIRKNDLFLDIGGNDGGLLRAVSALNSRINLLNIDPAENLVSDCREHGITSICDFWSSALASKIEKCKVIISTNVFQHTEDIEDFVLGINCALTDDGIWCLEFPYWMDTLKNMQFDQVYHEHIYYYLVTPLYKLFDAYGLKIINISEHPIHCGTMRLIIAKKGKDADSLTAYRTAEQKMDLKYYLNWGSKVFEHMRKCQRFVESLSTESIAGFGAAAKGCIFLNSMKHMPLKYIADDTKSKQGKFVPGIGVEIVDRKRLIDDPVDYLVILPHNFSDFIIQSLSDTYKGKFVLMFPEPHLYE